MNEIESIIDILKSNYYKYVIAESRERIITCLTYLSFAEIWQVPNKNTNSIGHLIKHLCGNSRQYILSGIGGQIDVRKRDKEFATTEHLSKSALIKLLNTTTDDTWNTVQSISSDEFLTQYKIQCFKMTTIDVIIHVIEHFTYHTGQIVYLTKSLKNIDTNFYADMDLG